MIRERVSANATIEDALVVGVFSERAEVEHPEVGAVASRQEALDVCAVIAVDALHADCREAHDDDLIRHIGQVLQKLDHSGCNSAGAPSSRLSWSSL